MIMRKKIKLPLEMADGVKVRTLDELKDNWSLEKVVENYLNGRLATWLNDRYYTELAEQVNALAEVQDNTALQKELCRIFDVDFADEEDIDVDAVNERNHKLDILRQYTADDTVLKNVDIVAFDQEELGDILDSGENVIYLFNNTFSIPLSVKNKKYIGVGKVECIIHSKDVVDFTKLGIEFENVVFDEKYRKIEEEKSPSKFSAEGDKLYDNKEYEKAIELYKKAAALGHIGVLNRLGWMYDSGKGVEQSDTEAVKWYRKGAEAGNAYAMNNLGLMYQNGKGVEQSDTEAVRWYRNGAKAGNANAMANVGYMYDLGKGVAQIAEEAKKWYKKAADAGNDWAMNRLGELSSSYSEELKWYNLAADKGNSDAMFNLVYMYRMGCGVDKDINTALYWAKKSASLNNARGMVAVGDIYWTWKDYNEASQWYKKAMDVDPSNSEAKGRYNSCIIRIQNPDWDGNGVLFH